MKKLTYIFLFFIAFIFSCSTDNNNSNNEEEEKQMLEFNVSQWTETINLNGEFYSAKTFNMVGNKIAISSNDLTEPNNVFYTSTFEYDNEGKLINIERYGNDALVFNFNFTYGLNNELSELNIDSPLFNTLTKFTLDYQQDSVIATEYRSSDAGISFDMIGTIEMFFNSSNSLTQYNSISTINSDFSISYGYDNNENLISIISEGGLDFYNYEEQISYLSDLNPISVINLTTFGGAKEYNISDNLYNTSGFLGWEAWSNISPNFIETITGENISTYSITKTLNPDNLISNFVVTRVTSSGDEWEYINEFTYE